MTTTDPAVEALEPPADHPQHLAARTRAAHAQAVEEQRLADLYHTRRVEEHRRELLTHRLRALGVRDPEIAWEPGAGPVSVVDGLRFELDQDDLVLVTPCPSCHEPMHSFPLVSLADLGALLERQADWSWHSCEGAELPDDEPEESPRPSIRADQMSSRLQPPPTALRSLIEALAEQAEGHLDHVRSLVTELGDNPELDAGVVAYTWIAMRLRLALLADANPEHSHLLTALPPIDREESPRP